MSRELILRIPSQDVMLDGLLYLPEDATGLVLFVHGSGSSRFSVRNQHVARILNSAGLATILFDLLTPEEEGIDDATREFRFDIPLLASRLLDVTEWSIKEPLVQNLPIGYFGSSTGGGAALVAAAQQPESVKAVVSRGGRPDLAGANLPLVKAPTLFLVGGNDFVVIQLNQDAYDQMECHRDLHIVPGATHLFEEPGTLDEISHLAKSWFIRYL